MAVATEVITLYDDNEKLIIAEVNQGEQYFIPHNLKVYKGSLDDFKIEYPNYKFDN